MVTQQQLMAFWGPLAPWWWEFFNMKHGASNAVHAWLADRPAYWA